MVSVDPVLPASDKGHPFIVKNSSILLPSLDKPIVVSGRSTSEIESAISEAYLQQLKVPTSVRIHEVRATMPATVIHVNQKSLSGIWKAKKIVSAGQVVPPEKAPDEFVFRRNQMIWKFTGKVKADDRVFDVVDVELDATKSPKWITIRSQDPKRPQPVLGLIDLQGNELHIFTKRDAKGNPSTERPTAIGTGNEPGTDLMILELKSFSVDEMQTYSIDEYLSNLVARWKKSSNDAEPSVESIEAKVTEVGNKLAEDIDQQFGPCNVIEFDATSKRLIIDHTPQAHQKIEAFLKGLVTVSTTQVSSVPVSDEPPVSRPGSDPTKGIETAKRHEQQAQAIAKLPRFYLYANYVSAWLDGMSDEADRSEANLEKAMNERLKPDTSSSTKITAWDEEGFLFGYDKPNLDGAKGNTRIVNHYFSHEDSIWQRQKTNKDVPLYTKLELPFVWRKVDANAFFHLRSSRLTFPWGNTDGNIKFALVPIEFAEYQVVGEETVDGAKCWVVMSKPRRCKLWFDQKSGRLLQMLSYVMQGVESTPFQETPEVEKLCGRKFETLDAFSEFVKSTDQATKQRLAGLYGSLYFDEMSQPIELTRYSDYREIAPGVWFPHQATDVFASQSTADPDKFRFSRGELRVITLETGRSLEETISSFVSEMPK
ncbi:MAG: TIGR03067 domain-containing protein [Pirellula sp.]|nr:TIGR03067 domain-containing protein [Pirellula sp.]